MPNNSLKLGKFIAGERQLDLSGNARARHLYVCGGTGVGKSKFLEYCVRQDILNWRDSKCGLVLLDPHGLVYQNTMAWLAHHDLKRPVIPIELRRDDWIVSYNALRRRKGADSAVVVSNFIRALSHVWGEGGTDRTPLFARLAGAILLTLYENGYTVSDFPHLLYRQDIQRAMIANVDDQMTQITWRLAQKHPKEFEQQISSTLNRFNRLVGPKVMQATFGQPDVSLDLLSAIEEGAIILVDLSTQGGQIEEEDADTFATVFLTDLWSAAKSRGKKDKLKPFYVYIDECQKFITPTIAQNLDQARGFGLHLTLANQFPTQFLNAGPHGKAMYDSIMANATNKIVFRLEHPDDAKAMGQWLFMNTFNPDEIKHTQMTTKVMAYRQEVRKSYTEGSATTRAHGTTHGGGRSDATLSGGGMGGAQSFNPMSPSDPLLSVENWNSYVASSSGESESWGETEATAESENQSVTRSIVDRPIMGQEVSSVQFRSIDEQIFRAMQKLFDQEDRHFAIRYHGGPKAPLFVKTPTVSPVPISPKRVEEYRLKLLRKLPFALPMSEATKRIKAREQKLLDEVVDIRTVDEPHSAGRRID